MILISQHNLINLFITSIFNPNRRSGSVFDVNGNKLAVIDNSRHSKHTISILDQTPSLSPLLNFFPIW